MPTRLDHLPRLTIDFDTMSNFIESQLGLSKLSNKYKVARQELEQAIYSLAETKTKINLHS